MDASAVVWPVNLRPSDASPRPKPTRHEEFLEVVWDGAKGRAGQSLTDSSGLGSSLGPASFATVNRSVRISS